MTLDAWILGIALGVGILAAIGIIALGGGMFQRWWLYLNLVADLTWRRIGDFFNRLRGK